jgi:hypothetical protein
MNVLMGIGAGLGAGLCFIISVSACYWCIYIPILNICYTKEQLHKFEDEKELSMTHTHTHIHTQIKT